VEKKNGSGNLFLEIMQVTHKHKNKTCYGQSQYDLDADEYPNLNIRITGFLTYEAAQAKAS
jgi:hypothetical protein